MNRGIFSNIAFPIPSTDCRIIVCQWDRGIYETYMFYISIIFLHISYKKENIKILSNTIWHPWVLTLQQPSWMVIFFWLWISEIHANIFKVFQFPRSDKIFPICPAKYSAKLRTSFQLSADRHNNTHIDLILESHLCAQARTAQLKHVTYFVFFHHTFYQHNHLLKFVQRSNWEGIPMLTGARKCTK